MAKIIVNISDDCLKAVAFLNNINPKSIVLSSISDKTFDFDELAENMDSVKRKRIDVYLAELLLSKAFGNDTSKVPKD